MTRRTFEQRLTSQQRRQIRDLLDKHNPLIREAFLSAIRNARSGLDFDALVRALELSDISRVAEMLRLNQALLFPLEDAIRATIVAGGASVTLPKGIKGAFSFNGRHPRAEQIIADMGARLVTDIGSPGPEAIRAVLLDGQRQGLGARKVAQNLAGKLNRRTGLREGGIMGLDGPRAKRSSRVRAILSDPDRIGEYFKGNKPRFTRTNRRFDAMVRRAIEQGRALSQADIDKIAKAHDARLLRDRAKVIAEDQAYTAQAQGRFEAYHQMSERPDVESVVQKWNHNTRENPRHDHAALDGTTKPIGEGFVMDDGSVLMHPHDPNAPAHHKIGCRCSSIFIPQFRRPGR